MTTNTNIIAPIPSKVIQTFGELFNLGYRIVTLNEVHTNQMILNHGKHLAEVSKVTLTSENFYVDSQLGLKVFRDPDSHTLREMARLNVSDLIWGLDARRLIRTGVFQQYTSEGFSCYLMPKPLHHVNYNFSFKTVRLKEIEKFYGNIVSSGVIKLYEQLDIIRSVYKGDFHEPTKCEKAHRLGAKKMSMGSPIVVGFYVLGPGIILNLVIFFVEIIHPEMEKMRHNTGCLDDKN